jgi:diketogulonate reductase-like aldo/keto reductase
MDINTKKELNDGNSIPLLGLGTYKMDDKNEAYEAVRHALDTGYRHIDTASMYRNEKEVGRAVRDSGIPREEIFVTTKVWNTDQGFGRTVHAFDESFRKLDLGYIDLYLIHWPQPGTRSETWEALVELKERGNVRSIGVSNYTTGHLSELLDESQLAPAVNQVEFSPFLYQEELLNYCRERKIALEAYSPLTRGEKLNNKKIAKIAEKYSKTPAQVMLRWALQHQIVILPKSSTKKRIEENADIFNFELSDADMSALNSLDENYRIAWDPTDIR